MSVLIFLTHAKALLRGSCLLWLYVHFGRHESQVVTAMIDCQPVATGM